MARAQTYALDVTKRDDGILLATPDDGAHFCRAPFLCTPVVRHVGDLVGISETFANGTFTSLEGGSRGRNGSAFFLDDRDGPHGFALYSEGSGSRGHGMFACGEVVRGHTITCTVSRSKATVAAPEIDPGLAITGMLLVLGCLAVLRGRKRSVAGSLRA